MYAIIATGGKQYTVSEGDVIKVEKLGVNAGDTVTYDAKCDQSRLCQGFCSGCDASGVDGTHKRKKISVP